ncbi:MAG TPA: hypothetical protein VNV38_21335 [Stellaceae bacterium]|jgi:hypothetical protein|nr:hypothetical protein [Stellaceae bacterium]
MLSFSIDETLKSVIEIHCDAEGIGLLISALGDLVAARASHVHLRTPSCGGRELSDETPSGKAAFHEVIIDYAEGD